MKIEFGEHLITKMRKQTTPIKAAIINRNGVDKLLFPTSIRCTQSISLNMASNSSQESIYVVGQGPLPATMHVSAGDFSFNGKLVDSPSDPDYDDLTLFIRMDLTIRDAGGAIVYQAQLHDGNIWFKYYSDTHFHQARVMEELRALLNPAGVPNPSACVGITSPSYPITAGMTAYLTIIAYQKQRDEIEQFAIRDYQGGTTQDVSFTIPSGAIVVDASVAIEKVGGTAPATIFLKHTVGSAVFETVIGNNADVVVIDPEALPIGSSITMTVVDNLYSGTYIKATITIHYISA